MQGLSPKQLKNFWRRVAKYASPPCWLWVGGLDTDGYGGVSLNGRSFKAHRVSWCIAHGVMPELDVLHTCDTPRCVNPAHLFLGTNTENVADSIAKGRRKTGEEHHSAKVSDEDVVQIKFLVALGWTCEEVGNKFNLSATQVHRIATGQSRRN